MRFVLAAVIFSAVSLALYANTLGSGLIWDDEFLIEKNRSLESWKHLPEIFQSSLHTFAPVQSNYYRPLQTFSYLIDRALWGEVLWGHHLTNVLLHGFLGCFFYGFGVSMGMAKGCALWMALFFLIHPLHTEAVSYISGRADPLSGLLILASLLLFHRSLKTRAFGTYLASVGLFGLALLSKEIAAILPFLLLLVLWYEKKEKHLRVLFPFFLLLSLYGILRVTLLDFKEISPFPNPKDEGTLFERGKISLQSLLLYTKLVFFPFPLYMDRHVPYEGPFWRKEYLLGGVFLALLAGFIFTKEKKRSLFGWGWFLLFALPHTSVFLKTNRIAEHFLYLALPGLLWIVVPWVFEKYSFFKRTFWKRRVFWIGVGCGAIYFAGLTIQQNRLWRDAETFYQNILNYEPNSWNALNNLGSLLEKRGKWERADTLLRKAILLKPHRPESYSNLGTLYLRKGNVDDAMAYYQKALRLWSGSPELHNNLASAYRLKKDWSRAIFEYQMALRLDPELVESRYFLAKTYEAVGKKELAAEQYRYLKKEGIRVELIQETPAD